MGVNRYEVMLMAGLVLATALFAWLWRAGSLGGFVVLVAGAATVVWAVWLGWRPALSRSREQPPFRRPARDGEFVEAA